MLISSVDPALSNVGLARLNLIWEPKPKFEIKNMFLVETAKQTTKQVRQNSDDLRRMQEIRGHFTRMVSGTRILFAEVPTGAQSARAAFAFGAATMLIAWSPVPVIQVQPFETKLATVGTRTASKEEMIEWAGETYPDFEWERYKKATKNHAAGDIHECMEHLADALAIAHAGIQTEQFKQLMALTQAAA